jgi:hypothetical protein
MRVGAAVDGHDRTAKCLKRKWGIAPMVVVQVRGAGGPW